MSDSDSTEEWNQIDPNDLWVYNKLFLSRMLGYECGPCGTSVPRSDFYIVRPSLNLLGMGRYSRIQYLKNHTDHLHPSEFWCEIFEGEHLSVDFYQKTCSLVIMGLRNPKNPLWRWSRWEMVDRQIPFPEILHDLKGLYDWINCEFIDGKLIEVHFRRNPDFRYGNRTAIPIWKDQEIPITNSYRYIEDEDFHRKGFLIS